MADKNNPKNDVKKEVEKILNEFAFPYCLLNECSERLTELLTSSCGCPKQTKGRNKKINLCTKKT